MRSVYHRLGHTLEFLVLQLVYKERQHYGYWESPQYAVEAQQYGVCDHTGAVIVAEKAFEPFEPHPLATEEAVHGVEVSPASPTSAGMATFTPASAIISSRTTSTW